MGRKRKRVAICLRAAVMAGVVYAAASPGGARQRLPTTSETVACRAIEVGTSKAFGVRLVIFHHQEPSERGRLGALLRAYNGGTVEIQTGEGPWQTATLLRLKTCFGRGLLVVPLSAASPSAGDQFAVRFPSRSKH